ncbi:RHS repeat-associated protein [Pseudomonas sp. WPR_5_2]|uniref:RHS repeat-associated core domain-containing protein n=1 Tax=Pseudomonas sp. WPR_5_2 TaxID=1907371 RepID=UPI000EB1EC5E|nr:RHS repeat-associated core domain-containing protein [Pseudomonas sp. WPR_5_2]RKS19858.1 RHS repeat-associated protein [Pseudomonas sp. WPR_5_2]
MPTHTSKTILLAIDLQNSVLNALEANQPQPIVYTPYGHRPRANGLLGFNGELPDPMTGHYHLGKGYRQFNPVLMRFNSPDSWSPFGEGGWNVYTYCGGDPVNRSDPTGHVLKNLRSFLRENIRVGAAKPPKAASKNVVSSSTNASRSAGVPARPSSSSHKPRAELHPISLSDSMLYPEPDPTPTTHVLQTISTSQQKSASNLIASDITRDRLLNRRTKSLGNISEDFNDYLDGFYFSKRVGPDGGFFTTQFAANPRSTHARLYAAMASEFVAPPTPEIQRIIRTGGRK